MLDPANELLPPPSSPTISSVSSSDFDTESTGSFFHDRSTTLGTLMGVTFPAITFRAPSRTQSQHRQIQIPDAENASGIHCNRRNKKSKKHRSAVVGADEDERRRRRRWRWWGLCRDECDCRPSSLGEFLEVERRFGDVTLFSNAAAELEGVGAADFHQSNNGRMLFADGRVLPPAAAADADEPESPAGVLCRFSAVSLSGICSGGSGGGVG
ncbi:OLC1v1014345C1 [Oldenlandia corymbosa var. corymbosa]|uniref:OLC1v1014345C1 n=1 Tax=Oldenlandia corymbosa var. corymbosa TaxID=529605 RepID=A0AAV1E305_OLDCO|nr:OLC1v1014345C1 [Oldenlandia corymbosa var. corymbosa]